MKIIHLSDLHIGKKLCEFSLYDDQVYILDKIAEIIKEEAPDAVFFAGDIYDRSVPGAEAINLFDRFLEKLSEYGPEIFIISGNHDSAERLSFGSALMTGSGVHIAKAYDGKLTPFVMEDACGKVNIYSLPFTNPPSVKVFFPDEEISSYEEMMIKILEEANINGKERNILITHQYVAGADLCDSEEMPIGGVSSIPASVFDSFDYVALGHIHSPQNVGSERIRYCGTPLKYSFSEEKQEKSVTVVQIDASGKVEIRTKKLVPLRDMVTLRGTYEELASKKFYDKKGYDTSFVRIILTDEAEVPDALTKLRIIYPYITKLEYDNSRTKYTSSEIYAGGNIKEKSPYEVFEEFYKTLFGCEMKENEKEYIEKIIKETWEEKDETA